MLRTTRRIDARASSDRSRSHPAGVRTGQAVAVLAGGSRHRRLGLPAGPGAGLPANPGHRVGPAADRVLCARDRGADQPHRAGHRPPAGTGGGRPQALGGGGQGRCVIGPDTAASAAQGASVRQQLAGHRPGWPDRVRGRHRQRRRGRRRAGHHAGVPDPAASRLHAGGANARPGGGSLDHRGCATADIGQWRLCRRHRRRCGPSLLRPTVARDRPGAGRLDHAVAPGRHAGDAKPLRRRGDGKKFPRPRAVQQAPAEQPEWQLRRHQPDRRRGAPTRLPDPRHPTGTGGDRRQVARTPTGVLAAAGRVGAGHLGRRRTGAGAARRLPAPVVATEEPPAGPGPAHDATPEPGHQCRQHQRLGLGPEERPVVRHADLFQDARVRPGRRFRRQHAVALAHPSGRPRSGCGKHPGRSGLGRRAVPVRGAHAPCRRQLSLDQRHRARGGTGQERQGEPPAGRHAGRHRAQAGRDRVARQRGALPPPVPEQPASDVDLRPGDTRVPRGQRCGGGALRLQPRGIPGHDAARHPPARGCHGPERAPRTRTPGRARGHRLAPPPQGRQPDPGRD